MGTMSPGSAVKGSELSGSLGLFKQPLTIVSQGSSDSKGISVSRVKGICGREGRSWCKRIVGIRQLRRRECDAHCGNQKQLGTNIIAVKTLTSGLLKSVDIEHTAVH